MSDKEGNKVVWSSNPRYNVEEIEGTHVPASQTSTPDVLDCLKCSNPNSKRTQSGRRTARRSYKWNKRNQPQFGPENEWELPESEIPGRTQRTERERRNYLWTGVW